MENFLKENKFYKEEHPEGDDIFYSYICLLDSGKDVSVLLSSMSFESIYILFQKLVADCCSQNDQHSLFTILLLSIIFQIDHKGAKM